MPRSCQTVACCLLACIALFSNTSAHAADEPKKRNFCVSCHAALPGSSFVGAKSHAWKGSIHQRRGVTCDKCHGGNPAASNQQAAHEGVFGSHDPHSRVYYRNIPSTCGTCHGAEFYKFRQSRHYEILQSTGKGAECVTCHGSMVTTVLTAETVEAICEQCHNERMGVFPDVPKRAKLVLLLLKESTDLLRTDKGEYTAHEGTRAALLHEAGLSLHSAKLDWHTFDLDAVLKNIEAAQASLNKLSGGKSHH